MKMKPSWPKHLLGLNPPTLLHWELNFSNMNISRHIQTIALANSQFSSPLPLNLTLPLISFLFSNSEKSPSFFQGQLFFLRFLILYSPIEFILSVYKDANVFPNINKTFW